jgi:O-antigen/teichoic acid export membrane protein
VRSRNLVFLRSILYGAFARIGGSLAIFVGLPVIAHALSPDQYATFLRSVSIVALGTLMYGAASTTTVRMLAHAVEKNDPYLLKCTERETASFFLIVFVVTAGAVLPAFFIASQGRPDALALLTVFLLTQTQGILTWSDAYRVALRSDHKASSWQLIGNIAMVASLVAFSHSGLWVTLLIYFGFPLLAQIGVTVQLACERPLHVRPLFHLPPILTQLRTAIPILLYGGSDYVKIFGSGLVVSLLTDNYEFARYSTIALFVNRLVSPLALITRPLLPAFINAAHERDAAWMRWASLTVMLVSAGSLIGLLGLSFLFGPRLLEWILPERLGAASLAEILCGALMLWGYAIASLLIPFYVASGREVMLSAANVGFVAIGILSGTIATQHWGLVGMLLCMGLACTTMAASLLIHSVTKVLRIDEQSF